MGNRGGVWFFWLLGGIIAAAVSGSVVPLFAIIAVRCAMEAVFARFDD